MRLLSAVLLLALATPARAENPVLSLEFTGEVFAAPIERLVDAKVSPNLSGNAALHITFDAAGIFSPVTARNAGTVAIIRICGNEISRPIIQTELGGETLLVPLADPADAPRLAAILNARACATS